MYMIMLWNPFQNHPAETHQYQQQKNERKKTGYKNDLHVGKTVDNLLFVTRQTTYASEICNKKIRKKKCHRSQANGVK